MMGGAFSWLVVVTLPATAAVLGHIALSRLCRVRLYPALGAAAGLGFLILAGLTAATIELDCDGVARAVANALIYACFCYVYFHFNNMGETARRIRLLRELVCAGQPLTYDEILARYDAGEIVARRLERLVGAGQVRIEDGRYVIAGRSVHGMALMVGLARWVIFGGVRQGIRRRAVLVESGLRHHGWWAAALSITALAFLPLLFAGSLFWDDWTWFWVYRVEGAHRVQDYMWQVAHPGYGPLLNLFFWAGGETPGPFARAIAVLSHVANGWLIFRIFSEGRGARAFAVTLAVLYLLSPYVGVRGSLAHAQYDVFILCYLASIWLSGRQHPTLIGLSFVAALAGLSIEPLAALEPVRWWYLVQRGSSLRAAFWRSLCFASAIFVFAILRVTWLKPHGAYTGYNVFAWDFASWAPLTKQTLRFFVRDVFEPTWLLVKSFWRHERVLFVAAFAAAAAAVGLARLWAGREPKWRETLPLAALGVIVLVLGSLPYLAIGQAPSMDHFASRFAVASQVGALIILAVMIRALPGRALRAPVLAAIAFFFAVQQFQLGKWMLYDEQMMRSFREEASGFLGTRPDRVVFVQFEPKSRHFLFRERCLSPNDMNVWLDLADRRNGSYLFDRDCTSPGDPVLATNRCTVSGRDFKRCPARRQSAEFKLSPGMDRFYIFSVVDLIAAGRAPRPLDGGRLIEPPVKRDAAAGAESG